MDVLVGDPVFDGGGSTFFASQSVWISDFAGSVIHPCIRGPHGYLQSGVETPLAGIALPDLPAALSAEHPELEDINLSILANYQRMQITSIYRFDCFSVFYTDPSIEWALKNGGSVTINADLDAMYWTRHNNSSGPGVFPAVPMAPDVFGPLGQDLGVRPAGTWPQFEIDILSVTAHSYLLSVGLFAWGGVDEPGAPTFPPPPEIEFTPPPIPNCSGGSIVVGGASAGTVPD